jgi:hypothetical protein
MLNQICLKSMVNVAIMELMMHVEEFLKRWCPRLWLNQQLNCGLQRAKAQTVAPAMARGGEGGGVAISDMVAS